MKEDKLNITIIDDDEAICNSLRWLCETINLPVKTYHSPKSYLDNFNPKERGCLIVDVRLPHMSGLELIEHINSKANHLSIIVITGYGDIPMAVRAMKAGAIDFVLKPFNEQNLLETIQKCLNRPKVISVDDFSERFETLTQREQQVLHLILEGKLNKEIAYALSIAISTVEAHRARIMQKMQVKTLAELMKLCFQFHSENPFYRELAGPNIGSFTIEN
ncbi:DNA-binding response regulator [Legionella jordanis]|uniref:response regulator transcription factor n=1 Tax=Legionella jordanis TaxID=456 RepID=UPI000EFE8C5C|nr:response regulator [Legionella jordanis]RMX21072.1 DNA-binding response regulator [Legionella jordanis]